MAWTFVKNLLGEVCVWLYTLVFLLLWLPEGLKLWFTRGRKKDSKNENGESYVMPPQNLGDPTLGRHLYAKVQVIVNEQKVLVQNTMDGRTVAPSSL